MRIADMETDKARNMVEYEEDIKSRPKKSWFQTNQEKREARERNPASGRALEGGGSKRKAEVDEEDEEESTAPQISKKKVLTGKKEDKYAGMSRAKRRRVQMQEMDELEAARDKAPPPPAPARLTPAPCPVPQPPYRPALFSCRR
jgi:ATP-dependent RNA helicase DDX27